jgi:nitrogen fixation NifU-like protein
MDDLYRDEILEHYRNPHNFGTLPDADATYEGSNPLCGDRITLSLRFDDAGGTVQEVAFTGRGCAISQASASMLTDEIKGKPVAKVSSVTNQDVLDNLGIDISPARLKCALLSVDTLRKALAEHAAHAATAQAGA